MPTLPGAGGYGIFSPTDITAYGQQIQHGAQQTRQNEQRLAEGDQQQQLNQQRLQQGASLQHANDMALLQAKIKTVGQLALKDQAGAKQFVEDDPLLKRYLGSIDFTTANGLTEVRSANGVTAVYDAAGNFHLVPQKTKSNVEAGVLESMTPEEQRQVVKQGGHAATDTVFTRDVVDPQTGKAVRNEYSRQTGEFVRTLGEKPEGGADTLAKQHGAVLSKYLKVGRKGLTKEEANVADSLLKDPDVAAATKLVMEDVHMINQPAAARAQAIQNLATTMKGNREPAGGTAPPAQPPPAGAPAAGAQPLSPAEHAYLKSQGFSDDAIRAQGFLPPE